MKNANKAQLALNIFARELQTYGLQDEAGNIAVEAGGTFRRRVRNRCVTELEVTWASSGSLYAKALEATRNSMAGENKMLTIATRKKGEGHEEKMFVASKPRAPKDNTTAPATQPAEEKIPEAIDNVPYSVISVVDGIIGEVQAYTTLQEAQHKCAARNRLKNKKAGTWQVVVGTPDPGKALDAALQASIDEGGCRAVVQETALESVQPAQENAEAQAEEQA